MHFRWRKWVRESLTHKILVLLLLAVTIPAILIGQISYHVCQNISYQNSHYYIQKNLNLLSETIDTVRQTMVTVADNFTYNDTLRRLLTEQDASYSLMDKYYDIKYLRENIFTPQRILIGYDTYFFVFDEKNELYTNYDIGGSGKSESEIVSYMKKNYLNSMEDYGIQLEWQETNADFFNKQMLVFSRPLSYSFQQPIGKLLIFVDIKMVDDIFSLMTDYIDDDMLLLNEENTIIAHTQHDLIGENLEDLYHIASVEENEYIFIQDQDEKRMLSSSIERRDGWKAVNLASSSKLLRGIDMIQRGIVVCVLLTLVISLLISVSILQKTMKRLGYIRDRALEISSGNCEVRLKVDGEDELALLSTCLNHMLAQIGKLIQNIVEEHQLRTQMEIAAYQARINPHFLLNTLNEIKWMAVLHQQPDIVNMMAALGKILETTLRNSSGMILLKDEVELLKAYVEIEKNRYQNKFDVIFNISDDTEECEVLNLLLQPLVENSIFYGIDRKPQIHIYIDSYLTEKELIIVVEDDGPGIPPDRLNEVLTTPSTDTKHIGLASILKRIELTFGEPYGMEITSTEKKGTRIQIALPILKKGVPYD